MAAGDPDAAEQLAPFIYHELRKLARRHIAKERAGHTLQATALVNEAYLKIARMPHEVWQGRSHFMAVASTQMRRILIDYARARKVRPEGQIEAGAEELLIRIGTDKPKDLVALNDALDNLQELNPRAARVVEMRFFGGLSEEEIASELGVSVRTVKRDWAVAKARMLLDLSA
jgi:RNA polymerase sigma factor (TIGR02999 family)